MKERSLVAFTILSEVAVGTLWTLSALEAWAAGQAGRAVVNALARPAWLALGPIMVVALSVSLFHLGTPANAWRAVANLPSSWLSREILLAILFAGVSCLLTGLEWAGLATPAARSLILSAAALLGLALIVSMANAYRLRTIPAWDSWGTLASFLVTALMLGGLTVGALLVLTPGLPPEVLRVSVQWITLEALALMGAQLALVVLWLTRLRSGPEAAVRSVSKVMQEHRVTLGLRLALAVSSIVIVGLALSPFGERGGTGMMVPLALELSLVSEVLGRGLFYVARVRHGV